LTVELLIAIRCSGTTLSERAGCGQDNPEESSQYFAPEATLRGHGVLMVAPRVERTAFKPMSQPKALQRSAFDVQ
jgi:hypothetical protein